MTCTVRQNVTQIVSGEISLFSLCFALVFCIQFSFLFLPQGEGGGF